MHIVFLTVILHYNTAMHDENIAKKINIRSLCIILFGEFFIHLFSHLVWGKVLESDRRNKCLQNYVFMCFTHEAEREKYFSKHIFASPWHAHTSVGKKKILQNFVKKRVFLSMNKVNKSQSSVYVSLNFVLKTVGEFWNIIFFFTWTCRWRKRFGCATKAFTALRVEIIWKKTKTNRIFWPDNFLSLELNNIDFQSCRNNWIKKKTNFIFLSLSHDNS